MPRSFWRWFEGSEVVNEDGSPRVVFHGTRSPVEFDTFLVGTVRRDGRAVITGGGDASAFLGPHFAQSPEIASAFACGNAAEWDANRGVMVGECGGRVIPVYLAIRNANPFDDDGDLIRGIDGIYETGRCALVERELRRRYVLDEDGGLLDDRGSYASRGHAISEILFDWDQGHRYLAGERLAKVAQRQLAESARAAWIREGYDGVRYQNSIESEHLELDEWDTTWVPFRASQVKSAVGNDGRYRKGSVSIVSNPPDVVAAGPGEPGSARELIEAMRVLDGRRPRPTVGNPPALSRLYALRQVDPDGSILVGLTEIPHGTDAQLVGNVSVGPARTLPRCDDALRALLRGASLPPRTPTYELNHASLHDDLHGRGLGAWMYAEAARLAWLHGRGVLVASSCCGGHDSEQSRAVWGGRSLARHVEVRDGVAGVWRARGAAQEPTPAPDGVSILDVTAAPRRARKAPR